jgi:hypothetical protein
LGYAKPTIVYIRELRDGSQEDYETAMASVISKLKTAKSNIDIVMVGTHNTIYENTNNKVQDDWGREFCRENGHLFVDIAKFWPSYADGVAYGLNLGGDDLHLTSAGNYYVSHLIWSHMADLRNWSQYVTDTSRKTGVETVPNGVNGSLWLVGGMSRSDISFGVQSESSGSLGPVNSWHQTYYGTASSTGWLAGGFSMRNNTFHYDQYNDSARNFRSLQTSTAVARTLSATSEVNSGTAANTALIASGVTSQTGNIFEVRTTASPTAAGTLVSGANSAGRLFSVLGVYADDAAADADSTLPSGGFYRTTGGGRAVFQKP